MIIGSLELGTLLLLGAAVVLVAVFAARLSARFGLPTLLVYLGMGVVLGEGDPISQLRIHFDDAELARTLSFAALVLILAEGGLTTKWSHVRRSMPLGLTLATVGVAVTTGVVGLFAHLALGFDWRSAFLLGAITAPTDAAAVFSVLRKVPLPRRLSGALEAESGLNDAPTVLLVTLLSTSGSGSQGLFGFVGQVVWELVLGVVVGLVVGFAGGYLVRRVPLPASGLAALAVFALAVLAFGLADVAHASGFAAVYVAALALGNGGLPYRRSTGSFAEGLAWLAQIGLFVMLGLLAWPSRLTVWDVMAGVLVGIVLTFVARPLAVAASATPFGMRLREQAFLSWAGLRGAVPIVLATIPLAANAPRAEAVFDVVFVLVIVFTFAQGPTLGFVARRLGVGMSDYVGELDVEVAPLETLDADLLELTIPRGSRLAGVEVAELRLPQGASVALLVREKRTVVPVDTTVLRRGDDLLVVAPRPVRDATEDRLRRLSRGGRLAKWRSARPDDEADEAES